VQSIKRKEVGSIPTYESKNKNMDNQKKGLGDKVADIIKFVAPKLAEKKKDCPGCLKRKTWLNNNGTFG
tara:strand:+ start:816 stop:1022 length:207 start_codon:yes stop_codon:yes gene_type:complete